MNQHNRKVPLSMARSARRKADHAGGPNMAPRQLQPRYKMGASRAALAQHAAAADRQDDLAFDFNTNVNVNPQGRLAAVRASMHTRSRASAEHDLHNKTAGFGFGQDDAEGADEFASSVHDYGFRQHHQHQRGYTDGAKTTRWDGRWGSGALGLQSSPELQQQQAAPAHGAQGQSQQSKPMSKSANLAPHSSLMRRMMRARRMGRSMQLGRGQGQGEGRDAAVTVGERVVLCGSEAPELDGASGIVVMARVRGGRAAVRLDGDGRTVVCVKHGDLRSLDVVECTGLVEGKRGGGARGVRFEEG